MKLRLLTEDPISEHKVTLLFAGQKKGRAALGLAPLLFLFLMDALRERAVLCVEQLQGVSGLG